MGFLPMQSRTEGIVNADSGFMVFDLTGSLGYQEWCGMFAELGVKSTLFNGYLLQRESEEVQISTTPLQLHSFDEGMYLAPPFEGREYYFYLPRAGLQIGKVYFKIPPELASQSLDGYKPTRGDLYAIDIWVQEDAVRGISEARLGSSAGGAATLKGSQVIYTLLYEARIKTDRREYHIERFESEQLFGRRQ
jgi:hypothetical protein